MDNQLSTTHNKNHNIPISNESHGDIKNLINYFWNMLDFPQHSTMKELEPKIEVNERENEVTVSAEIPGIAPENLDVEISADGYLTLSGEKRQQKEQNQQGSHFSEISYGMFKRTIPLPWDLEFDNANAEYDNGVLNITIPKSPTEQTKKKKININKKAKN